jgi:hypothetical protein
VLQLSSIVEQRNYADVPPHRLLKNEYVESQIIVGRKIDEYVQTENKHVFVAQ